MEQTAQTQSGNNNSASMAAMKLAGRNVCRALCISNKINDLTVVSARILDTDKVLEVVADMLKFDKPSLAAKYSEFVRSRLSVHSKERMRVLVDQGRVFTDSVSCSREAIVNQKHVMQILVAERFLKEAYEYDIQNNTGHKAVDSAKAVILNMFSPEFLVNFVFDDADHPPYVDARFKEDIESIAFDPRYSFVSRNRIFELAAKKYMAEFDEKKLFFQKSKSETFSEIRREVYSKRFNTYEIGAEKYDVEQSITRPDPTFDKSLFTKMFLRMPTARRPRCFVNLRAVNLDALTCTDRHELIAKKRVADIERKSKHAFIIDMHRSLYANARLLNAKDISEEKYLFICETRMYRKLWPTCSDKIVYKNSKIYLPDGSVAYVQQVERPYETLHRVNAFYAAMFGFKPELDLVRGASETYGKDKLENTIRAVYTDEGNAMYRQFLISAKLQGNI